MAGIQKQVLAELRLFVACGFVAAASAPYAWAQAPGAAPPGRPVGVSSGVMAANLISRPDPVFPEQAKAFRVNGAVVMKALISKTGDVEDVTVISGPELLRAAYVDAVKQWKYKPYLLNGQPVDVETVITMTYYMGASPSDPPTFNLPLYVSSGTMAGRLIYRPDPRFPPFAKDAHVSGAVALHVLISKTGDVEILNVITGPPVEVPGVVDAVKQWKYKPYLVDGQPVEVETTVTLNFDFGGGEDEGAVVVPKHIGGSVSAPVLIFSTEPDVRSIGGRWSCSPRVNLWVDAQGMPSHVKVVKGCGDVRDHLMLEAVKQYRFKPAMENGKPVVVELNVELFVD